MQRRCTVYFIFFLPSNRLFKSDAVNPLGRGVAGALVEVSIFLEAGVKGGGIAGTFFLLPSGIGVAATPPGGTDDRS